MQPSTDTVRPKIPLALLDALCAGAERKFLEADATLRAGRTAPRRVRDKEQQ